MPELEIVRSCSPTLAGLKTGSLFRMRVRDHGQAVRDIRELNRIFRKKGLRAIPMRYFEQHVLLYVYRPDRLSRDLNQAEAQMILREKGYVTGDTDLCLAQLVRRLRQEADFPHEIGLFLSYPPSDVRCFMQDPHGGVQCVGCWKAYGNREKAEKTFRLYQKCTEVYCRRVQEGRSLEQLIVRTA